MSKNKWIDLSDSWRCDTHNLLKEILEHNKGMAIMKIPINIFQSLLAKVGERASEINDKKLNQLMGRLTIYAVCDPSQKEDYDADISRKVLAGEMGIHAPYLKAKLDKLKTIFSEAPDMYARELGIINE